MMGIGGFSRLSGFMTKADWKGVCENFQMADGTFWPVPITLDVTAADAAAIKVGDEIALVRKGEVFATMKVTEKFEMTDADKKMGM
jgi:sulfate adenylyltransferase